MFQERLEGIMQINDQVGSRCCLEIQVSILYSKLSTSFTFSVLDFDLMWINASLKKDI